MIDWDAAVHAPLMAVFGEDLKPVYQRVVDGVPSGAAFEVDGIFDDAHKGLVLAADGEPEINTIEPVMGVRLAQFAPGAAPAQGDLVTIPRVARTYVVKDAQPDGKGWVYLVLVRKA